MGNAPLRATRPLNWDVLAEERPAWGASEIAYALGVNRVTVRQWLYRQRHYPALGYFWGCPTFFPQPDAIVGGRPVWLSDRGITWWLATEILPAVSPWYMDPSFFEQNAKVRQHMHPDDVRRLWDGEVLAEDSPMAAGIAALEGAKHRGLPPLVIALGVTAWEAFYMRLDEKEWRPRVLKQVRTVDALAERPTLLAVRTLRTDDLWPWNEE